MRISDWSSDVCSSDLPLIGEYERAVSTIFNSCIGPIVGDYVYRLEARLKEQGMPCPLLVMQTHGGLSTVEAMRNRPLLTVDSGPAGGVLGGRYFSDLIGARNVTCVDVGGTDRKSVVEGQSVVVRVALGGGRRLKKQKTQHTRYPPT